MVIEYIFLSILIIKTPVPFYNKDRAWLDVGKVKLWLSCVYHDLVFVFYPEEFQL